MLCIIQYLLTRHCTTYLPSYLPTYISGLRRSHYALMPRSGLLVQRRAIRKN